LSWEKSSSSSFTDLQISNNAFPNSLILPAILSSRMLVHTHKSLSTKFAKDKVFCLLIPGTDVMITIFCDIWQFLAKNLAFFLKNQCYDHLFA
jgi:hypothetical protein